MPWQEALDLVHAAMAHTLRGDQEAARATVALVPASMLRGCLVSTLEVWAGSVLQLNAGREGVGELLAEEFARPLLEDGGSGG